MRHITCLVSTVLLAACTSLPSYVEPSGGSLAQAASIDRMGSTFSFCGFTIDPICNARVNVVDGARTSMTASSVRIEPGLRRLQLLCFTRTFFTLGHAAGFVREVELVIPPGAKYRVDAKWRNEACELSLVDVATGHHVEMRDVNSPVGKPRRD